MTSPWVTVLVPCASFSAEKWAQTPPSTSRTSALEPARPAMPLISARMLSLVPAHAGRP